jgi:hypothetical protein
MKLQADNINGVCKVESFDAEPMSQDLFYSMLSDNDYDSIICSEVDHEMAARIDAEYGIH